MTRIILLSTLAFAVCCEASSSSGRAVSETDVVPAAPVAPCTDCRLELPAERSQPLPLLVVLHGNHEDADASMKRWRDAALGRGWAVLGLTCPEAAGCKQSRWYRWNGDPAWVTRQVRAVGKHLRIDPGRVFLAGWSGGATYIGMNAHRWPSLFSAVVYHGGGQPPLSTSACPTHALPAYFLVGDENWAHGAARKLRAYYERCDQEHVWDLLEGADHPAEDRALDRPRADRILRWLDDHAAHALVGSR